MRFTWSFKNILTNSTMWHSTPQARMAIHWVFFNQYAKALNETVP